MMTRKHAAAFGVVLAVVGGLGLADAGLVALVFTALAYFFERGGRR